MQSGKRTRTLKIKINSPAESAQAAEARRAAELDKFVMDANVEHELESVKKLINVLSSAEPGGKLTKRVREQDDRNLWIRLPISQSLGQELSKSRKEYKWRRPSSDERPRREMMPVIENAKMLDELRGHIYPKLNDLNKKRDEYILKNKLSSFGTVTPFDKEITELIRKRQKIESSIIKF
jgi:hypothetical protein